MTKLLDCFKSLFKKLLGIKENKTRALLPFFAEITEIKENGNLVINAGQDTEIFVGCCLNLNDGICLVISVNKKSCIAEIQPKKIKNIDFFSGDVTYIPYYPNAKIGDIVKGQFWRAVNE